MPRAEARVKTSIWDDADFLALDRDARYVYLFVLSQAGLEYSGVLPLRMRALARKAAMSVGELEKTLMILDEARFVVYDEDTEEVCIRSLIRRDEIYRQPYTLKSAMKALAAIESQRIRAALLEEVRRISVECAGSTPKTSVPFLTQMITYLSGSADGISDPIPGGTPKDGSSDPIGEPFTDPFADGKGEGEGEGEELALGSTTSSSAIDDRDDVTRICEHLADRIVDNGSKRPRIGKRWRDAARLMIDADGRSEDQIHKAIDWCQNDEFWRANIMSLPTLRSKYDRLRLAAQRAQTPNARTAPSRELPPDAARCPEPHHENQLAAHCSLCAADRKAARRTP